MPGRLHRSRDGLSPFEAGPQLFPTKPTQIHTGVLLRDDRLHVCYTRADDTPERILYARVAIGPDWRQWSASEPQELLRPQEEWEGSRLTAMPARIGAVDGPIHALRDPYLYRADGQTYLVYAIAGESGLAMARVRGL